MCDNFKPANRFEGIQERYWEEMLRMVRLNNPANLASGFSDYTSQPQSIMKALANAALTDNYRLNQYASGYGHPRLLKAVAKIYTKLMNREINAETEVLITLGAYEALYCTFAGIVNPGDEVIIIEPHYECYVPMTKMCGGIPVFVPLRPSGGEENAVKTTKDWKLDFDELESKFTDRTRLIIINTPHNPLGKVFSRQELVKIAKLCVKYDVIAVMDEVYEWLTYDDAVHFRLASLPGMFERSITIGSSGKTFSVTGWRVGWVLTSNKIRAALSLAHQTGAYTAPTILQEAIAIAFEEQYDILHSSGVWSQLNENSYWFQLSASLRHKREIMVNMLTAAGMKPIVPEGGYFIVADCKHIMEKIKLNEFRDDRETIFAFVKWLSKNGIQTIPVNVFYSEEYKSFGDSLLRFCFFKAEETLTAAQRVFSGLQY